MENRGRIYLTFKLHFSPFVLLYEFHSGLAAMHRVHRQSNYGHSIFNIHFPALPLLLLSVSDLIFLIFQYMVTSRLRRCVHMSALPRL